MKLKKIICVLLALTFVFLSVSFTAFAQVSNDDVEKISLYEKLLSTNQLKEVPLENAYDTAIKSTIAPYKVNTMNNIIQNEYSNSVINNIDNIFAVDYVLNNDLAYEANCDDGSVIGFDNNMNIISYSNFNNDIMTQSDAYGNEFNSIDNLKSTYKIDSTYQLSISNNDNYKTYCWEKLDSNGIKNPYDSLKIVVDTNTNDVVVFNVFSDNPDSDKISITKDDAIKIALEFKV